MAAVLFKWEEENKKGTKRGAKKAAEKWSCSITELIPFAPKGREPFYHIAKILENEQVSREDAKEAEKLLASGRIRLNDTFRIYENSYEDQRKSGAPMYFQGTVDDEEGHFSGNVDLILTTTDIRRYWCSICRNYYERYYTSYVSSQQKCPHILGFLIKVDDYVKKFDPGDFTDYRGLSFLNNFGTESIRAASDPGKEKEGTVTLEPRITEVDPGQYDLEFRIGNGGKMYGA
jgi:hypothetical protein